MFFGSKSPGFQCSFKTRGSSIAHGARSPCSMWHLCVTASIHGTAWMAPNSAHIDGPPQQLKLMEWVLAMHMWKPVKPVYSYPATWCNMFKYLNHSLAKKQTFVHASQNLSEIEIEPGDHWISFSKCQGDPSLPAGCAMGFTRRRQKSSGDHRISRGFDFQWMQPATNPTYNRCILESSSTSSIQQLDTRFELPKAYEGTKSVANGTWSSMWVVQPGT